MPTATSSASRCRAPCCLVRSLRSCEMPLLAGPVHIEDATRAEFRMTRIAADVAAQMPAAHALRLLRWVHADPHVLFARAHRIGGRRIALRDARLARDQ